METSLLKFFPYRQGARPQLYCSSKMKTEDDLFPCQCCILSFFVALKNLKERNIA